jgi:hypothetical protein
MAIFKGLIYLRKIYILYTNPTMIGLHKKVNYESILRDSKFEVRNRKGPNNEVVGFMAYLDGIPVAIASDNLKRITVTKKDQMPVLAELQKTLESRLGTHYTLYLFDTKDKVKYTKGKVAAEEKKPEYKPSAGIGNLVPNWAYRAFDAFRAYVPAFVPERDQ